MFDCLCFVNEVDDWGWWFFICIDYGLRSFLRIFEKLCNENG